MNSRRNFLQTGLFSAGAMALMNRSRIFAATEKPPMRFIFMHRGNGLWPKVMVPPSLSKELLEKEKRKEAYNVDLDGHDLPEWMSPLTNHVDNMTIL